MPASLIHPTALIDSQAQLEADVEVGPYTIIGPHVQIGRGTKIGAHCVIEGHTQIGQDNHIFHHCSLGAIPQDKKYKGQPCRLQIGHRNTIREFCSFHIGTVEDQGLTSVGDDNWIMAYVHLAHDCQVGHHTIFANNSQLAGHVHVGDWAILGGFTVVHQFVRIGAHAMTAMCSLLFADLPPFVMAQGQPAKARSMNFEGLKRRGFSEPSLSVVKTLYKLLYRSDLTLMQAIERIHDLRASSEASTHHVFDLFLDFLKNTHEQRGLVR